MHYIYLNTLYRKSTDYFQFPIKSDAVFYLKHKLMGNSIEHSGSVFEINRGLVFNVQILI